MPLEIDPRRLQAALDKARSALLAERNARGHWTGELSSSALSTATAVCALQIVARETGASDRLQSLIQRGLEWLAKNQNVNYGGWGDTDLSFSNISTTTLCWAVFGVVPGADEKYSSTITRAEKWLREKAGGLDPDKLADAIIARYGKDRTFSIPILTMCALSGRFGNGPAAWRRVIPLPFELAAFPQSWFAALRLPVVSYALPALIAIGQARHRNAPSRNPLARAARNAAAERTLNVLERIQPTNGGFLEATPLTSFVTMSLAASGLAQHPVVRKGVEFLVASVRADGSWPIDTNLATWVTTLSVNALANDPSFQLPADERTPIREWLLDQQYRVVHPYTGAAPGGWAWTDLPGGVPDADDTAGALLALKNLSVATVCDRRGDSTALTERRYNVDDRVREAAALGVQWLLDLQNRDGGIPTFCRGWTNLPFDRSGSDLTAHAIRAWLAWLDDLAKAPGNETFRSVLRATDYLIGTKGDVKFLWTPLWFGNQHSDGPNIHYGTAKVLDALAVLSQRLSAMRPEESANPMVLRLEETCESAFWGNCQHSDGSFGGLRSTGSSVEETALTIESLSAVRMAPCSRLLEETNELVELIERENTQCPVELQSHAKGPGILPDEVLTLATNWLISRVESGTWTQPAPIGFYFAKLWYYEKLYPMIFTVGALGKAAALLRAKD
jgi:squalene-hopene/tetraprenyl-beta-curcumene cyclase